MWNNKELMHCHCGTNNRSPLWTFTDPCKPEVRPGAREESASVSCLASRYRHECRDTTKVFIWRLDTGCGPTPLYRKCHSHNTPSKRHNNTWVEPLAGNCTTSSTPPSTSCIILSMLNALIYKYCISMRWDGRLSPRGNIVDRGRPEIDNALKGWRSTMSHIVL